MRSPPEVPSNMNGFVKLVRSTLVIVCISSVYSSILLKHKQFLSRVNELMVVIVNVTLVPKGYV